MLQQLRAAFTLLVFFTLLAGVAYPLTVMAFSHLLFHDKANGSLIERGGKIVGSTLLGQQFESHKYFWGRLSATTPPYNAAASGGSNLSPNNPKLLAAANARMEALQKADPANHALVPVDLITASASGLDPHISVLSAMYQLDRVARARGLKPEVLEALVVEFTEKPGQGLLGEAYVNVLELNLALDKK